MWLTKQIVPLCTIHLLLDISTVGLFFQAKVKENVKRKLSALVNFHFSVIYLTSPFDLCSAASLCRGLILLVSSWVLFNSVLSFYVSLVDALSIVIKVL